MREELIVKQTDIVDNLAKQMHKANDEMQKLKKEAQQALSQRDSAFSQLSDLETQLNNLEQKECQTCAPFLQEQQELQNELQAYQIQFEKLALEKDQLKHKNQRY